jgi:xanthine dehydrogenase accessory factor
MTAPDVLVRAGELATAGVAFALATVVAVERPASTRRGDRALVTRDGELVGWVGGACSEPIVIREALRALADGQPRLVRIAPAGTSAREHPTDVVVAESTCASEGSVEVLVDPQLPGPLLAVVGDSPAARTLAELARGIRWRVASELEEGTDAVVVATMGEGDEDVLAAALGASADYVGLVASSRRASAVVEALRARGLREEALARLRSPAGLDLGPGSQEEIAVAILAELVAWSHSEHGPGSGGPEETVDPVCGMTVTVAGTKETAVHEGITYRFCSAGCRARFQAEPVRYASLGGEVIA